MFGTGEEGPDSTVWSAKKNSASWLYQHHLSQQDHRKQKLPNPEPKMVLLGRTNVQCDPRSDEHRQDFQYSSVAVKSLGEELFSFRQCAGNFVTEDVVGLTSSSARILLESLKSSLLVLDHDANVFGDPGKIMFR